MNDPFEAYVLCANRTCVLGERFLDVFASSRQPLADEFPIPEFSASPVAVLNTACDAMKRLEREPSEGYALYWSCDDTHLYSHAMLVFTRDGGMIAGLVTTSGDPGDTLLKIAEVVSGRFGYITAEGRPPDTCSESIAVCKRSTIPTLVDGLIHNKKDRGV